MSLRTVVDGWKHSTHTVVRAAYRVSTYVWWSYRLATDGRFRSEHLEPRKYPDQHFQVYTATAANRYPALFDDCRQYLDDHPRRRLLSFGCSTGEEVLSLAGRWPQASIVGVDINAWCIVECQRRHASPRRTFLHRMSPEFAAAHDFDAIFCLAVFQRTENRINADNSVAAARTFEQFEREIVLLDAKLKPGGLLVIDHADFRFTDTACASRYTPLDSPGSRQLRRRPLYDRNNRKLADEHDSHRIYVKGSRR
jgi:trans-aconitate methyltransferase